MRLGLLWQTEGEDKVRCGLCERRCLLKPGQTGLCKTRQSLRGGLYTLVYGDISALSANPIEKGGGMRGLPRESPSSTSGRAASP
ncbi:MAG: hypothetical protein QW587_08690 [Candidatus Bathyarchaeia archaeon]